MSQASATVQDVVALSGRGTVVIVGDIEGTVLIGDQAKIAGRLARVTGLEGVRFANPQARPVDTIGVLLDIFDLPESEDLRRSRIALERSL